MKRKKWQRLKRNNQKGGKITKWQVFQHRST